MSNKERLFYSALQIEATGCKNFHKKRHVETSSTRPKTTYLNLDLLERSKRYSSKFDYPPNQ